jgi:putative Holliday junction resolvase
MKILGIDYGTKRIGIAMSDEMGQFAFPLLVLDQSTSLAAEIKEIAKAHEVRDIVIGESKDYKGKANESLAAATDLKDELEDAGFDVHWEPEFMTSMHVERLQGKSDLTDASAAAIILQSFLDKKAHANYIEEDEEPSRAE